MSRTSYCSDVERSAQARDAAIARAAQRAGVTPQQYRDRCADGEKFCSGHKEWHSRRVFGVNSGKSDGLDSSCRELRKVEKRESAARSRRKRHTPIPRAPRPVFDPGPDPAPHRQALEEAVEVHAQQYLACATTDPELFFPVGSSGPAREQARAAKALCAACPVREACLRGALKRGEEFGIFGGLDEAERAALARGAVAAC